MYKMPHSGLASRAVLLAIAVSVVCLVQAMLARPAAAQVANLRPSHANPVDLRSRPPGSGETEAPQDAASESTPPAATASDAPSAKEVEEAWRKALRGIVRRGRTVWQRVRILTTEALEKTREYIEWLGHQIGELLTNDEQEGESPPEDHAEEPEAPADNVEGLGPRIRDLLRGGGNR